MTVLSGLLTQLAYYYESHPLRLAFVGNKVAIEPIFDNDKSRGGLYIPDQAKGRCSQGIIKYLGAACSGDYAVGDYVIFSGYDGDLIRFEDSLTIVMPESHLQAKIIASPKVSFPAGFYTIEEALTHIAMNLGPLTEMQNKISSRTQ